jgi:type I restriction enzyme R subunit
MTSKDGITDKEAMDREFEDMFKNKTEEEKEAILKKHGIKSNYLDAPKVIEKKAQSMVRYYIENIFVNGFKAQVVVNSRKAAITYKEMIDKAIIEEIEALKNGTSTLDDAENIDIELLETLLSTVIMSGNHNDTEEYKKYTDKDTQKREVENFKKPFKNKDPKKTSSLGFIIVTDMLLTGFDAPIEQVLFLDRKLIEHNLLQTIARVNRTASGKNCGYLVDYYGV